MPDTSTSLSTSLSQTAHTQANQQSDNNAYIIPALVTGEDQAIQDLYFLAHSSSLWLNADNPDSAVTQILTLLKTAEEQGLSSRDYNISTLETRWETLQNSSQPEASKLAHYDAELSRNLLRFLSDLHWGRDLPQRSVSGLIKPLKYDFLVKALLRASNTGNIAALSSQIEPDIPAYQLLKRTLKRFRSLTADTDPFDFQILRPIEPGDINLQIPLLRQKLTTFGLLQTSAEGIKPQTNLYDSALVKAVQNFQRLHGLAEDGVIGRKTVAALNTPISQRIQQLELGMERLRWLLPLKKNKTILVNIPAFRLWAFRDKHWPDREDFSMKVVVGIAGKEQTPVFTADLAYLVFRPYWNVPDSIAKKEILPALEENPDYLDRHNMEFVQSFRNNAEPQPLTTDTMTLFRQGSMKVRQRPGRKNALGLVKFIFPNRHAIYLHDTPAKSLFRSDRRDFSHGCIRVEQPMALAEYILQPDKSWSQQQIRMAMNKGENQWVHLDDPATVTVFYSTVQAISDEVYYYDDIYGYDAALIQTLNGGNPTTALVVSDQILP